MPTVRDGSVLPVQGQGTLQFLHLLVAFPLLASKRDSHTCSQPHDNLG